MSYRIIVCGIYRSGTSLTTNLIRTWGAYAGKPEDLFEDEYGYLEHLSLQRFNDELLDNNNRVPPPESVLLKRAEDPTLTARARHILSDMDEEAQALNLNAWAWKDPRIPLALPFWSHLWEDAIYVIPVRHPLETIYSAAKMEGLETEYAPLSAGLIYWQYCMLNILKYTQNTHKKIFIAYDKLIQEPEMECKRLSNFLDHHCEIGNGGTHVEDMVAQVKEGRRHFYAFEDLANVQVATPEQRGLYNFLRLKTIYPFETYQPQDFALYPGWSEFLQMMDMTVMMMQSGM
jgi:hypothetical protein